MKKVSEFIMRNRLWVLLIISGITVYFAYTVLGLSVKTNFNDLLPQNHPYVKVHNKIRHIFGGAAQVLIMVQVRNGDIFNQKTLEKVKWISRELETIPGVDPYKIRSIAVSKMKDFKFSSGAMNIAPLMFPDVPKDEREMQDLKDKIYSNPRYYGQYVSYDSKKTLIMVDFFEEDLNYEKIFEALGRIREKTEDENHIINIAGEPMHLGYIKYHVNQVLGILAVTVFAMIVMLYVYYRSKRAMFVPVMTSSASAVWGLGFMALLGYNLDPLIIIMPFLISLMTARHSIQLVTRYMEEFGNTGSVKEASKNIIQTMLIPGLASIVTDALGIALVALAVIPALTNIAIVCSFWFLATTIMSMIMTPVVLSYIPSSERFVQQTNMVLQQETSDYRYRLLNMLGHWIPRRGKWYVAAATIALTAVGWVYAEKIQIGDFFPGSSILWPFHRYNKDAFRITFSMPLLNPLYVILEGETGQFVTKGETLREMNKFQRYMAQHERVMFAYSIANNLPGFLMASYEDDPQWSHLPKEDRVLSFIARRLVYAGEPGTWDQYIDMEDKNANIVIYCRDKMPATVESVISYIKDYIQKNPGPPGGKYVLAGGAVGVQAAVRETIADSQMWNLILALTGVFFFVSISFKSIWAGVLLTIPLAISNVLTFALMGAYHIGLTVNTYPVSSVGIGIGVDYGIYYIGRLLEERGKGFDLHTVICNALTSNGRSIIQIATTLTIGLGLWVLSPLKFQAEMGALLAILLLLNMLGALLLVPAMICIFKPSFIIKAKKA